MQLPTSGKAMTAGPRACLERRHGAPTLVVEGRPAPPMWYTEFPYEIYEQKSYGRGTREIRLQLRMGETRKFHLGGPVCVTEVPMMGGHES